MNNPSRVLEFAKKFHMITLEEYNVSTLSKSDDFSFLMLYKSLLMQELEALDELLDEHDIIKIRRAVKMLKG